ncbi:uncharacterized protein LOC135331315 isoform X2 [Halichondria panicea]|uniref:uncharacterized protein LOC135331315 isoform X2 n=1 Tax=Halichondria panicea TaxID=6063 RepID=UPI00312BA107
MQVLMMKKLMFCVCFVCTSVFGYPYGLEVTEVGAESVILKWHSTEKNVEEFKVHCSGIRHYMTPQKELHTELDVLTHFVPGSLTHLLIGDVLTNYNYSCIVSEQLEDNAQVLGCQVSDPFHFSTDYSNPEQPRPPDIHLQNDQHFRIDLFPVSSRHGPLLGYKIQFHVVNEEDPNGIPIIPEHWIFSFGEGALPNPIVVSKAHGPRSFQLSFSYDSLPPYILTDQEIFASALKNNVKYSVVTIAYSKNKQQLTKKSGGILFSVSKPSEPFVASRTVFHQSTENASSVRPGHLAVALSIGVILPLLMISWVVLIAVFLLCRARRIRYQLQNTFTRHDSNEFKKTQQSTDTDMLRLQSSPAKGDHPWLGPSNDSWNAVHTESTPTIHTDSRAHQISPSEASSNSLIQLSPSHPSPLNLTEFVMSEPTIYDISHFHQRCETTNPHKSNAVPLQYTTTVDKHTEEFITSQSYQNETERIQSPKFYSAPEFSSAVSTTEHSEMIMRYSSSSVFLPRGFSAGPQMNTFALAPQLSPIQRLAPQLSPIQRLLNKLSGDESEQEDQAPELEMDMYDVYY